MRSSRLWKALVLAVYSPWILWAALKLSWWSRRRRLDELVDLMARVKPFAVPGLRRPDLVALSSGFAAAYLPPYRMGACMRKALIQMDLLTRSGLEPCFHLGVAQQGDQRAFHAWLDVELVGTSSDRGVYQELWSRRACR